MIMIIRDVEIIGNRTNAIRKSVLFVPFLAIVLCLLFLCHFIYYVSLEILHFQGDLSHISTLIHCIDYVFS